jgi:hypothetical protein
VQSHNATTPLGHRAADLLCRYAIIRLAASSTDTITLDQDDLAPHLDHAPTIRLPDRLTTAAARRLAELDIFHQTTLPDGTPHTWPSGGFDLPAFGTRPDHQTVRELQRSVSRARQRGDTAQADHYRRQLAELVAGNPIASSLH